MCDEPYIVIGLGNAYDFVIKNVNEPETYGTFQGDKKSIKEFIKKVNSILKENGELKERNTNQYNQLTELWEIIEEENWEKLIAMKKQLKEDEERLQREWKCYE